MTPKVFISDKKLNVIIIICVACTFHLRWAILPKQHKENAKCNTGIRNGSAAPICNHIAVVPHISRIREPVPVLV